MMRRVQPPRWLVIPTTLYLIGVLLWFDFFFWMAVVFGAFIGYLLAFVAVVGGVMHLVAPDSLSAEHRNRD